MLNPDKYSRSVEMICPTCGGTQFEFEEPLADTGPIKCDTCKREFTKSELIELNSENISHHVGEMAPKVANDLAEELKNELRRTFSGNKYIKIR